MNLYKLCFIVHFIYPNIHLKVELEEEQKRTELRNVKYYNDKNNSAKKCEIL